MAARSLDDITGTVIAAAITVHRAIGPGLLESVYEALLAAELIRLGYTVRRQVSVSFTFNGMHFERAFRIDFLVEETVIVEVKSVEQLQRVNPKQLLTYLRLMQLPVGLLINFNCATIKDGLRRVVNNFNDDSSRRLVLNNPNPL